MRLFNFEIHSETATISPKQEYYQSTFSTDRKPGGFVMASGIPNDDDINIYANGVYENGAVQNVIEEFSSPPESSKTADFVVILEKNY